METHRVVSITIKGNLVALTGDVPSALLLDRVLHWSERAREVDVLIERRNRWSEAPALPLTEGWVHKSAAELSQETMLGLDEAAVRRSIDRLVRAGYLDRRPGPHPWEPSPQYRPNIRAIQHALREIGHVLDGYPLPDQASPPPADTSADWPASSQRAFEALRAIGIEPEGLARRYALEAPEAACRWTAYARREGLGPGYVRKHLDAGDPPPSLARPASPPPPGGTVYR